ncbi:hypothetical protein L6452_19282 [Arctium lappa]|uniref:Uncharacterized protein n=1 Tax=Arctium lappa TaxID=4217 RepID=A0ACB9B7K5_ARCLA|nr:hypothetical protein L6452_19282 [Arctium lappa]
MNNIIGIQRRLWSEGCLVVMMASAGPSPGSSPCWPSSPAQMNNIFMKLNVYNAKSRLGQSQAEVGLATHDIHPNFKLENTSKRDGRRYIEVVKGLTPFGDHGTVNETKNYSTFKDQSLVAGKILIDTIDTKPIEETLTIKFGARTFKVRVSEDAKEILEMSTEQISDYGSDEDSLNTKDGENYVSEEGKWEDGAGNGYDGKDLEENDSFVPEFQSENQSKYQLESQKNNHSPQIESNRPYMGSATGVDFFTSR